MAKSTSQPDSGRPEKVYYSKAKSGLLLLLCVGLTAQILPVWLLMATDYAVVLLFGLFALGVWSVLILPLGTMALRGVVDRGPVVTFSAEGVTDTRMTPAFVPWGHIGDVTLGYGARAYWLRFEFRDAKTARTYVGHPYVVLLAVRRLNGLGDWNVNVLLLNRSRVDLLKIATTFHRHALRQAYLRANPDGAAGWSRTL